jgi:hypothetical protein
VFDSVTGSVDNLMEMYLDSIHFDHDIDLIVNHFVHFEYVLVVVNDFLFLLHYVFYQYAFVGVYISMVL